jgi:hypothetical protein
VAKASYPLSRNFDHARSSLLADKVSLPVENLAITSDLKVAFQSPGYDGRCPAPASLE